jgi:hypothetical protein
MTEGITCYERDEDLCEDQMCLRTGCRLRNERLSADSVAVDKVAQAISLWDGDDWNGILGSRECSRNRYRAMARAAIAAMPTVAQRARKYDLRALAKFLYEHCALDPDKASDVAATLLEEYDIWPDDFAAQPPAAPVKGPSAEWCLKMAAEEEAAGDPDISAGQLAAFPRSSAEQPKDEQTCHDCGAREPCDEDCPNHVEPEPVQSCSAGTAKALDDLEIFIGEVDGSEAAEGGTIDGTEAIEALNALRAAFAQPQGAQVTEVDIHGIIAEAMDGYGLTWKGIRRASRNILNRIGVSPQTVPMSEKPRPADCLDPTGCLWRHVPTSPDIGLHLCSRFGCPHTTSAVTRPEHRAPSASSPAEAAPSQRPPE